MFVLDRAPCTSLLSTNLAAYVPDLPGCVATGESEREVEMLIREAIALHLEGMAEDGLPIPEPSCRVEYVEVDAWPRAVRFSSPPV
jgi:predicted RNase H-like HicB family nuclease